MNEFGKALYLYCCRILRILVSDRIDLSVGDSEVKVSLHVSLYIGIGT